MAQNLSDLDRRVGSGKEVTGRDRDGQVRPGEPSRTSRSASRWHGRERDLHRAGVKLRPVPGRHHPQALCRRPDWRHASHAEISEGIVRSIANTTLILSIAGLDLAPGLRPRHAGGRARRPARRLRGRTRPSPAAVRRTFRPAFSNSREDRRSSSARIWRDSAGWVMFRRCAASVMLDNSAAATKPGINAYVHRPLCGLPSTSLGLIARPVSIGAKGLRCPPAAGQAFAAISAISASVVTCRQ